VALPRPRCKKEGQSTAAWFQKLKFQAFAADLGGKLILLRGLYTGTYILYLYIYIYDFIQQPYPQCDRRTGTDFVSLVCLSLLPV